MCFGRYSVSISKLNRIAGGSNIEPKQRGYLSRAKIRDSLQTLSATGRSVGDLNPRHWIPSSLTSTTRGLKVYRQMCIRSSYGSCGKLTDGDGLGKACSKSIAGLNPNIFHV